MRLKYSFSTIRLGLFDHPTMEGSFVIVITVFSLYIDRVV